MPIYAYRCSVCGHAKDALQKISDAPLTTCPACGAEALVKQVTAAGFQLKGTGWYATDFKHGSGGAAKAQPAAASTEAPAADSQSGNSGTAVEKTQSGPSSSHTPATAA